MSFALRRSPRSLPLRRYVDCGGLAGAPNADSYDVTLSVVTEARKDGANASIVPTLVEAVARPATSRGDAFRCVTLGALERRIADLARAKAAQVPQ